VKKIMKKKKNIKIIKSNDKTNIDGNYTFIDKDMDIDAISSNPNSISNVKNESTGEQSLIKDVDEIYKKKVISKKEINNNAIKGLKFTKLSQRNHSSVYE
jgi:hypothetical protein